MATPYVAAAVALALAQRPDLTLSQIRTLLRRTADKVAGEISFSREYGHGRLNIHRALREL
jgi:subtilisin family serine protease